MIGNMDSSNTKTKMSSIEQQLNDAENVCSSLKVQLDYMKELYGNQSEPEKSDDSQKLSLETTVSQSVLPVFAKVPDDVDDEESDNKYYQILTEISKIHESPDYENEVSDNEAIAVEPVYQFKNVDEQSGDSSEKCHITRSSATAIRALETSDSMTDTACKLHENQQFGPEVSQSLPGTTPIMKLFLDEQHRKKEEKNLSARSESKKIELSTKLTESYESVHTQTYKKAKKIAKCDKKFRITNRKSSSVKTDESYVPTVKLKKKKCRLRSTNSKSTVTTNKESNVTDKRTAIKRRRPKSNTAMLSNGHTLHVRDSRMSKVNSKQRSSDVFEIYNNKDTRSESISFSSSKHSKVACSTQDVTNGEFGVKLQQKLAHEKNTQHQKNYQDKPELPSMTTVNKEGCREIVCSTKPVCCKEVCKVQNHKKETFQSGTKVDAQNSKAESVVHTKTCPSNSFDPLLARNYEMPTVASKLKQVQRSYFNRFNIRNIPFVVGTSVTPSHNLGLNIQQVLSIMKTTHPMSCGIHNLFIHKAGRGFQPVKSLLERLNGQYSMERFVENENVPDSNAENQNAQYAENGSGTMVKCNRGCQKQIYANSRSTYEPLYEEEESRPDVQWIAVGKNSHSCSVPKIEDSERRSLPQASSIHTNLNEMRLSLTNHALVPNQRMVDVRIEDSIGNKNHEAISAVSTEKTKEIHGVLVRLHNQFEDMNTRYVKMQEELAKRKIKTSPKELLDLESELEAKGEEIRAVVNLYREVMALKQQIKSLHDRKSFVCIATEETCRQAALPAIQPQASNRWSNFSGRKKITYGLREPSTASRLASLLRQIQAFQKQLSS